PRQHLGVHHGATRRACVHGGCIDGRGAARAEPSDGDGAGCGGPPMGTLTLESFAVASAGARIVDTVERQLHAEGVILCGSRAIGDARPDSDYDVFVVLPMWRIPGSLRAIRLA